MHACMTMYVNRWIRHAKESTSNSSARQKKPSQVRTDTRRGHHVTLIHGLEANTLWQLRFIVWHTCNDCWGSFCATHTLGHFLQRKGNLVMIYCSLQDLQANLQPLWSHYEAMGWIRLRTVQQFYAFTFQILLDILSDILSGSAAYTEGTKGCKRRHH